MYTRTIYCAPLVCHPPYTAEESMKKSKHCLKVTNNHKTSRVEEFAMALLNKIFLNLVLAVKIDFDALASAVAFDYKIEAWDM